LQVEEKSEVAAYAASLIKDGELIYIDAGTTTGSMIDRIRCYGATFVTNGVRHGLRLAERGLRTYILSGYVKTSTEAITGHDAVTNLQKYHFDKCFIGTDGVDSESGLTTADIEESMVKTEAIGRSSRVYVLADSSKFGKVASVKFAPLEAGTIITDKLPVPAMKDRTEIIELNK
ncbi:MAG: DeoR/GlpR transcriptional regulator, partial [Firmicutes bacterium]|nr:DeoR/GlpR transcriptional regulator [Bacillota bacterium]